MYNHSVPLTDFAVGAPHENDGVVYIYHGSANGKIDETSTQVLA